MLNKLSTLLNSIIPLIRKRDIAYFLVIGILSAIINLRAEQ